MQAMHGDTSMLYSRVTIVIVVKTMSAVRKMSFHIDKKAKFHQV